MGLKRVTFTGPDDGTDIGRLMALSATYPWIEWGILLPPRGRNKGDRFPSYGWIQKLIATSHMAPFHVQLAGHLCPPWTGEFVTGQATIRKMIGRAFDRIQVNTHGDHYAFRADWLDMMHRDVDREYILQLDGDESLERLRFARDKLCANVTGLHDLSHGAGVLPSSWPAADGHRWIGYAGGLGPENLHEQLVSIARASAGVDYWIDMETHIRTQGVFDLDKVTRCIEIAAPFVDPGAEKFRVRGVA